MLRGVRLYRYRQDKRVAPAITSSAMSNPAYGSAYSHSCTATGPGILWSIASGALPTGLSINAGTGAITGTPTASGAFSGTIRATNAAGYAEQAFSVVVSYLSKVQSIAGANLVLLYSLIGSSNPANDLSGNGYHGVINGATPAGGAVVPFPEGGNAILLDGINDNIDGIASAAAINKNLHTVMIWFKMSQTHIDDASNHGIFQVSATTLATGVSSVYKRGSPKRLWAETYPGGLGVGFSPLFNSDWHFVAIVRDGANSKAYFDSAVQNFATATTWSNAITSIFAGSYVTFMAGSIAMFAIVNANLSVSIPALATP